MTRRFLLLTVICLALLAAPLASADEIPIGGRVVLPWGDPLAEADVRLRPLLAPAAKVRALLDDRTVEPAARAVSDSEGRFRILAPHAGLWTVSVEAPGFVPTEIEMKPLIEPIELPDTKMESDSGLTVTVTGPRGAPLSGARVLVRTERSRFAFFGGSGWGAPLRSGVTGDDGKLLLPRGESERVIVSASRSGFAHAERRGLSGQAARLALASGTGRKIEVRSSDGKAVPDVVFAVGDRLHPLGKSDAAGLAELVLDGAKTTAASFLASDGRRLETRLAAADWKDDAPRKLVLPDRLAVSGRLIDAESRRAIAGGVVWDAQNPVEGFVTDDAGGFVLTGPAGSRLDVTAGAPRYLPARGTEFQLTDDGRPGPTLALHPAAAIEGKIVDGGGNPVAGAEVASEVKRAPSGRMRIEIGAPATSPRAISGPKGSFRLSPVDPDKSYVVKAQAEGFAPADETVTGLEPYRTKSGLRIELDRGKGVVGTVVDSAELALRDVEIVLKPHSSGGGMGMIRIADPGAAAIEFLGSTDAEGAFHIDGLPEGKFDLEAYRPGFARKKIAGVAVASDEPVADLGSIILETGERVQGLVTDRNGLPLEGVEVFASSGGPTMTMVMGGGEPDDPEPDAVTDPNGWFTVNDLAASEKYAFSFQRGGFVNASAKAVELPRLEPLQVTMDAASDVSGVVADVEGEPIAGAVVNLRRSKTIEMGGAVMQTIMMTSETADAEGRFLFADQEPGSIALSAVASGYQEAKLDNVEIPKGEDVSGIELPLPAGAIVQGRVLLPDGRPAIGAEVRVVKEELGMARFGGNPTDGNGYYRLEGLVPGPVSIEATHDEYPRAVKDTELDEGIHSLDLHLQGGHEVSGLVTSIDGDPVVDAVVSLVPAGRSWGGPETRSASGGAFSIPGVPDGDYTLWVEANDYAPASGEQQVKVDGEPYHGLEVRLDAGGTIAGKVTGLDPEKFGKVTVRA